MPNGAGAGWSARTVIGTDGALRLGTPLTGPAATAAGLVSGAAPGAFATAPDASVPVPVAPVSAPEGPPGEAGERSAVLTGALLPSSARQAVPAAASTASPPISPASIRRRRWASTGAGTAGS